MTNLGKRPSHLTKSGNVHSMDSDSGSGRKSLAERRRQLLDAAVEVMAERGISGTTTRAITDQAGVPQGTFHYCFDSKGALLRALLEQESEGAFAGILQIDPDTRSYSDALAQAIIAQLARVRATPKHYLVLAELGIVARTDAALLELVRAAQARLIERVSEQLRRWLPDRTDEQLRAGASVIVAGIDGLTESWLTSRDDQGSEAATVLFAEVISTHRF